MGVYKRVHGIVLNQLKVESRGNCHQHPEGSSSQRCGIGILVGQPPLLIPPNHEPGHDFLQPAVLVKLVSVHLSVSKNLRKPDSGIFTPFLVTNSDLLPGPDIDVAS